MKAHTQLQLDTIVMWLTETPAGRIARWVLESVSFGAGILMAMFVMYQVETKFMPVITNWTINPVVRTGDTYELSGTFVKERPCTLLATSVLAVPKAPLVPRITLYQIKPTEIDGGNIPTGANTWGPWTMKIPRAFIENRDKIAWIDIIGHHQCHGFWAQETYYGRVEMTQLP